MKHSTETPVEVQDVKVNKYIGKTIQEERLRDTSVDGQTWINVLPTSSEAVTAAQTASIFTCVSDLNKVTI